MNDQSHQSILVQKRDQFRVKIRQERLNTELNNTRFRLLQESTNANGSGGQLVRFLNDGGVEHLEERAKIVFPQVDVNSVDDHTLMVMCNLCVVREPQNVITLRNMGIAPLLLGHAKQLKEQKQWHTCLWGLMNYIQLGCQMINDAHILGDINYLIQNGLLEIVLVHWANCQSSGNPPKVSITISELLFNLMWLILNQKIINPDQLISGKKVVEIFDKCLFELPNLRKTIYENSMVLPLINTLLQFNPDLFKRSTQQDVYNLLNLVDRQSDKQVFSTMKILLTITRGKDETVIQRLIFLSMITDVLKQFYHQQKEIRILAYKIINNLCLAETVSVKESVGCREIFMEVVQNFTTCFDDESLFELTQLLGVMCEQCIDFLGIEIIEDSRLGDISLEKLQTTQSPDCQIEILKLILALVEFRICRGHDPIRFKAQDLYHSRNPIIAQLCERILCSID